MRRMSMLFAVAGVVALGACDVDKTKEGNLPDVDVNVSGGNLPEYNVQGPDIDVNMVETNVTVPKIETEEKTISVPDVNVKTPKD